MQIFSNSNRNHMNGFVSVASFQECFSSLKQQQIIAPLEVLEVI